MFKRFLALAATILGMTAATLVVATPAQADPWPPIGCISTSANTTHAYGSGGSAVYASGWFNYGADFEYAGSNCLDLNVYSPTAPTTVRAQFCPAAGGPSFSCYSMGWGSLTPFACCNHGVTAHWYHFPSNNNLNWLFRIETLGTAEQITLIA